MNAESLDVSKQQQLTEVGPWLVWGTLGIFLTSLGLCGIFN